MLCKVLLVLTLGTSLALCKDLYLADGEMEISTSGKVPLSEKIRTFDLMILKYDQDLEQIVPLQEIREAIQGLDIMSRNYPGASRGNIFDAASLGSRATDNYFRGTDHLVHWCSTASVVFEYILKNQAHLQSNKITQAVQNTLNKGVQAIQESIRTLGIVASQLSDMEQALRPVPDNLRQELKTLQLETEHKINHMRRNKNIINTGLTALGMLTAFVLTFFTGPVASTAIGVGIKMGLSQIPTAVIEGKVVPSLEQKIKITEAYYLALTNTVEHASINVTNVKFELEKSLQFVQMDMRAEATDIEGHAREEDQLETKKIIKELRDLKNTVDDMNSKRLPTKRHFRARRTIPNQMTSS